MTEFRIIKLIKYFIPNFKFNINISILFIFRALPFFMIGIIVRKQKVKQIKTPYVIIMLIFGSTLAGLESILFKISLNTYIGTYFQLIALISFCLKESNNYHQSFELLSYIGRELSDKIYIYHIAVKQILFHLLIKMNIIPLRWYAYTSYFFVLLCSIIFSYLMKKLTNTSFYGVITLFANEY